MALPPPSKPALSPVAGAVEPGHALSTQIGARRQLRFGVPSSARSSTQASTTFGPVAKDGCAVGTATEAVLLAGQGLSAVANPSAIAQLRMSSPSSAPLPST